MDPLIGASLVSAGGNLLGGLLGNKGGDGFSTKNYKAQKQFAQNSIRWKVKDAKFAGIHPLFAMGANPASFTPSAPTPRADHSYISQAADSIARGMQAKAAEKQAQIAFEDQMATNASQRELNNAQADYWRSKSLPGSGLDAGANNYGKDTPADPKVTIGPIEVNKDPSMPDAQTIEDRYGELPGWAIGAANIVADTIHSKTGVSLAEINDWMEKNLPEPSVQNLPIALKIVLEKAYDHFTK